MKTKEMDLRVGSVIEPGLSTELAIDLVKSTFVAKLSQELSLYRVTAPIAVEENTGINDDLNGTERAVSFPITDLQGKRGVVVQSLAKWKRLRLQQLEMEVGQGIVTDMKAIRPDEKLTRFHSIFVDQWDWERVISNEEMNTDFLKFIVRKIYSAMKHAEGEIFKQYPDIKPVLPEEITFIHAQELLNRFPLLAPKQREDEITRECGAVFIIGIGASLSNGHPHDMRAPDYDDWSTVNTDGYEGLNGDIIVWNPVTESALELSSMGIRVNADSMMRQLEICRCTERSELLFHRMLLNNELPLSVGGGIGQSRLCMYLLRKQHIGEVQVGIWPAQTRLAYQAEGVSII